MGGWEHLRPSPSPACWPLSGRAATGPEFCFASPVKWDPVCGFHDWTAIVTTCGRICYEKRKVNLSDLGHLMRRRAGRPIENSFRRKLFPE